VSARRLVACRRASTRRRRRSAGAARSSEAALGIDRTSTAQPPCCVQRPDSQRERAQRFRARGIVAGAARVLKVMKSTPYLAPHQRRFSAMRCVTGTGFLLISVIINGAHAALSSVKH
jgi:hypothetical protein